MNPLRSSAEVVAALVAVRSTPANVPLRIMSKGIAAVSAISTHLHKWEDNRWIGVPNPAPLTALAAELRARQGTTVFAPPSKESSLPSCRSASTAAKLALETNTAADILLATTHEQLRGAKLSTLTQALAYQGIRALQRAPTRLTTEANVALTQDFLKDHSGHAPVPSKIWESIRHNNITSTIKSWLWKSVHGAHRIGSYW
ncbi:hypothetical protein DFH07DRAFT_751149, partial [Mycena maculata]